MDLPSDFYDIENAQVWCRECKQAVFAQHMKEYQGEIPHGGIVEWWECPVCGSNDMEEVGICGNCAESTGASQDFCDECTDNCRKAFKSCIDALIEDYDLQLIANIVQEWLEG